MSKINDDNCPLSTPVPISVTVNTSGSCPSPTNEVHSLSSTNSGFTGISEFTFTPKLTSTTLSIQEYLRPEMSVSTALWDFGDGYSLEGDSEFIPTHKYKVPGIYTATVFFYDPTGRAYVNTLTESVSVYNYTNTHIELDSKGTRIESTSAALSGLYGRAITAGNKQDFQGSLKLGVSASWQDIPNEKDPLTIYFTSSGSLAKPYDTTNKYAHLIPYNTFYDSNLNRIPIEGLDISNKLIPHYFAVNTDGSTIHEVSINSIEDIKNTYNVDSILLYSSFSIGPSRTNIDTTTANLTTFKQIQNPPANSTNYIRFSYYDDIPVSKVNLLLRLDTSKHRLKQFYVDDITTNINGSNRNYLETNVAGVDVENTTQIGFPLRVLKPTVELLSFTSTGMSEMSAIDFKRHGDKFQIFIALADKNKNLN